LLELLELLERELDELLLEELLDLELDEL